MTGRFAAGAMHRRLLALGGSLGLAAASLYCGPPQVPPPQGAYDRWTDTYAALCTVTVRTLARPSPAKRLFVEGYLMRSLVAASAALEERPRNARDSTLSRAALSRAVSWADTLASTQDKYGFWRIGYGSAWIADMAAALALFPAVEPHVDTAQLQQYTTVTEKFMQALERDHLLLESGSVGIGWPMGERPENVLRSWRSDVGWADSAYVVATALAGVAVQTWLWRRTGRVEYRDRARRSFDETLAALKRDGTLPTRTKQEGPYTAAAYVEEGWMAAYEGGLLDSVRVEKLRAALPRHVDWLVRSQRPDGLWGSGVRGDDARALASVDFLLWYNQRLQPREDVRKAIDKAVSGLVTGVRNDAPIQPRDDHHEVWRAHVGRPLAALVQVRPVP
jgi:hypothetical protein